MRSDSAHSSVGRSAFALRPCRYDVLAGRQLLGSKRGRARRRTATGLLDPGCGARVDDGGAAPIPGGLDLTTFGYVPTGADVHFLLPGIGFEMSTITDFNGVVGGSETRGTAHGSDGSSYTFDCDMRFMEGLYVGLDGRPHIGSFGFI